MNKISTKKLVFAGLFLALGLILPFFTGQIQSIGNKLLPMHIPVLICGFMLGWQYGMIVGFTVPLLRSILFGMPPMFPVAIAMAFELAAYGLMTGLLYKFLPKKNIFTYVSLILSMIAGRIVWGIVSMFLYGMAGMEFTKQIFIGGAFLNAIPGIIIQLLIIPVLIISLEKSKVMKLAK